jgi:putative two-component system response regulator
MRHHLPRRKRVEHDSQLDVLGHALRERTEELKRSREATIRLLAAAVDVRDDATGEHAARTAEYAYAIARRIGLSDTEADAVRLAVPLHDIGKIAIPDSILHKCGPLTFVERLVVETHAETGYRMLAGSGEELLEIAATIAWTHHERIDGSGYPRRLVGAEIPAVGRLTAVADVADALMSSRPYRSAYTHEQALEILLEQRGRRLDADMVDALLAEISARSHRRGARAP